MRDGKRKLDGPFAVTLKEFLAGIEQEVTALQFGQEIAVRRAVDRPTPTPSDQSGEPAFLTVATFALPKAVPRVR